MDTDLSLCTTLLEGCADSRRWRYLKARMTMLYRRMFCKEECPAPVLTALHSQIITLPTKIASLASRIQTVRDLEMVTRRQSVCRTAPLTLEEVAALIADVPLDIVPTHEVTVGGMSRIYATSRPDILLKISDISRGWSRYEGHGYELLRKQKIPAASIVHACFRKGYLVVVVERMEYTVSSVIQSVTELNALYLDEIVRGLRVLLSNLRRAQITFTDLTPDNIVCRRVMCDDEKDTVRVELALIDPQFAVPTSCLANFMGTRRAQEFDAIHLSLKIMAMGVVYGEDDGILRMTTSAVSCALLGVEKVPSTTKMTHWLLKVLPVALRLSYEALNTLEKNNGLGYAGTSKEEDDHRQKEEEHQKN